MSKLKRIKELFSSNLTFLGFLTNLGLVFLTYVIFYTLGYFLPFEGLSLSYKLHIFSITYLILVGATYQWALDENEPYKAGFVLAIIIIVLLIMLTYIKTLF